MTCNRSLVFSRYSPVSSTIKKTDSHDITEILLTVALNPPPPPHIYVHRIHYIDLSCYVSDCTVMMGSWGSYIYVHCYHHNMFLRGEKRLHNTPFWLWRSNVVMNQNLQQVPHWEGQAHWEGQGMMLSKHFQFNLSNSAFCFFFFYISCSRLDQHVYIKWYVRDTTL